MIGRFVGKNDYLSNFFECSVTYKDKTYLSTEAAFQAQKTKDKEIRKKFALLSPSDAKSLGREIKLRPDWEDIKVDVMYEICRAKFIQHPELAVRLLATGNEELVEGNNHGDTFWGMVNGKGENYLGRILMCIRNELRGFNAVKTTTDIIDWIKEYFQKNGSLSTKAIIGISGGKDSSICAALCVKALGKDRVLGVLMPQGEQADIDCSRKIVEFLGIDSIEVNIADAYSGLMNQLSGKISISKQAIINTPARLRMTTLYAVAACVGGRVVNTCNLSEDWVGYSTKFGDNAGDFSILGDLTVTEILSIGDYLKLPYALVHKVPIDGLSGKTDEDNFGFTYSDLDNYIRGYDTLSENIQLKERIDNMHNASRHKIEPMPKFTL